MLRSSRGQKAKDKIDKEGEKYWKYYSSLPI